jgi:LysM repeat protein
VQGLIACIEYWLADRDQSARHPLPEKPAAKTLTTQICGQGQMARTSTTRIVVWSLALLATAGAVLSIDKVLRQEPVGLDAVRISPAILPSPSRDPDQNSRATVQAVPKNVPAAVGPTGLAEEIGPAFDVARVEPSGDAVIAGRAAPGASVELLRNGEVHGRVVADASGQFAMVPAPLPPGDSELTLRSRQPDGRLAMSKQSLVVSLDKNRKEQPVVALMTPDKPSVVLSKPAAPDPAGGSVVVETVETESGGRLYVSGRSSPLAAVRLYVNDGYLASTTAAANGRFAFTVDGGIGGSFPPAESSKGGYRVRLDEVEQGSGAIRSRAEVPFNPSQDAVAALAPSAGSPDATSPPNAGPPAAAAKDASTVVSRGDSLWRISRAAYGDGARYTVIYEANHGQIRNPDRIYPGQVLVLPVKAR